MKMEQNTMARFSATSIFKHFKTSTRVIPPVPEKIWQDPIYFIAFGFGSGAMPFAPGTFGTLMAIPFYLLCNSWPQSIYIGFVLLFVIVSSFICARVSRDINVQDHPGMCLDEFVGFFVTMINAPHGFSWLLLGFVLFRLFDILKPWPIYFLDENIKGGFGMILDDIVAGIFSCLIIQIIAFLTIGLVWQNGFLQHF